ncbi:MAG: tetratricopeptide repeat protein [Ktedonobacteraceae bacterium]
MKANQLKVERVLRGWSQAKVSEAVGTNVRSIIRWEQGQTLPHPYYREQLCTLFGKNARELGLLEDEEDESNEGEELQHPQSVTSLEASVIFDPAIPVSSGIADSLIGRECLLTQVKQQLGEDGHGNQIALHGLPGMGKTSLAVALTLDQALRDHFYDGILWAGLGQEPDVPGQLARWGKLLGVTPKDVGNINSREAWGNALHTAIGSRHLLLVIDDAWSVEDALAFRVGGTHCAHVLTTRLPHVAFVFAKERTLAVPELQDADGLSLLAHFVPTLVQQDRESALALVKAVGGSPLALTLMGNYLADVAFTRQTRRLQQALAKLHDAEQRLRLSAPSALAQRSPCLPADTPISLYAAIAVSTQRLDKGEYDALRALAIFPPKPNSFSEEAALAVSTAPAETLDILWDTGLLESSGSGRYTLHQTIADYAHYASDHPARDTQAHHRLVDYVAHYIQEHGQDYEALEREQSTILTALDLAATLGLFPALLQGVLGFVAFMRVRGHYSLAQNLLSQALQVAVAQEDALKRMQLLRHLAEFANLRGEYGLAESYSQEGLSLARQMGQQHDAESALLTTLGLAAYHRGDYGQAKGMFEEGLRLARNLEDRVQVCTLLTHFGRVLQYQGNYQQAETLYQEGLKLAQESNQHELLNLLLIYLGGITMLQGHYQQAQRYYQESLSLARSLGHRELLSSVLNDLGNMAIQRGEFSQAISYFEEGLVLARRIGHCADRCLLLSNLATVYVEQGNYDQAEVYLREGIELASRLENRNRLTVLLTNLGCVLSQQGDYEQANSCFRESLALAHAIGSPWYIYGTLLDWGENHLKHGYLDAAEAAFHEILAHEKSPVGEPELLAGSEYGLARVALLRGNVEEALRLAGKSETDFAAIGHYKATIVREWQQSHILAGSRSIMLRVIDEGIYRWTEEETIPVGNLVAVA